MKSLGRNGLKGYSLTYWLQGTENFQPKCCQDCQEEDVKGEVCEEHFPAKLAPLGLQEASHQWVL